MSSSALALVMEYIWAPDALWLRGEWFLAVYILLRAKKEPFGAVLTARFLMVSGLSKSEHRRFRIRSETAFLLAFFIL